MVELEWTTIVAYLLYLLENYVLYCLKTMLYCCMLLRKLVVFGVNNFMYLLYLLWTICCICMVHFICEFIWLFDLVWCILVCVCCLRRAARCIMERPAEELFYRANTRCKIEHPAGQISAQRALSIYSAAETTFSAPKFSVAVGDALSV